MLKMFPDGNNKFPGLKNLVEDNNDNSGAIGNLG
jgi:hypothetical protein